MPGPKKLPRHLKLLRGTVQPCRDVASDKQALPAIDCAIAPAWMQDEAAIAEFKRLAAVLTANKMLTGGNVQILAHLAMLHARVTASWTEGGTPSAALLTVYRRLAGDLGLTALPMPTPTSKPNRFFELAARGRRGDQ